MILVEAVLEDVFLLHAPFEITTGRPVGDVAFGDFELEFIECVDDLGVGDVVAEHAVEHVADGVGKAGDFAVAGAGSK